MKPRPKFYNKSNCLVCDQLFYKRKKKSSGRRGAVNVGAFNRVTCSSKCSVLWSRERCRRRYQNKTEKLKYLYA